MHKPRLPDRRDYADALAAMWSHATARWRQGRADRRGAAAVEFALVALPFLTIIFFIFALGLHFYYQELLNMGLHVAIRQIQTGNAQNVANGSVFVNTYLCPDMGNLVTCSNLYIKVQKVTFTSGQDYYNSTTGTLPVTGGALDLSSFGGTSFCNAGSSEFILVTGVYVAPSLIGWALPNVFSVSFGGSQVDAIMAQVASYTETYTAQAAAGTVAPPC